MATINTCVINRMRYAGFLFIFFGGGVLLLMFFSSILDSSYIMYIGLGILAVSLLLFQKKFRDGFTKNAVVDFSNDSIKVELFNRNTNNLEKTDEYKYNAIKSFKAQDSSRDDSCILKLSLEDGSTVLYTFLGQGTAKNQIDIMGLIFTSINSYNDTQDTENRITITPNFFATKVGTITVLFLTVLLILAIIIQLIYNPKTIPFSLIPGISLFAIIITQRKRDVDQLKRMK